MVFALPRSTVIHSASLHPELHRLDTLPSTTAVAGQVAACTEEVVTALFNARFTEATGDVVVVWALALPEPPSEEETQNNQVYESITKSFKRFL